MIVCGYCGAEVFWSFPRPEDACDECGKPIGGPSTEPVDEAVARFVAALRAVVRDAGDVEPDTPEGRLVDGLAEALRVYDAGDDAPGSIPGLPAGDEFAQPRMAPSVPGMGGTGLEPVPPESDIGADSGTEGPEKDRSAGDSEGPERPLAVSKGPVRTPGIGASGSKAGLVVPWRRPRCTVPGCEREVGVEVVILVGGERTVTRWCLPHAAEYRVEEGVTVRCPTGLACTGCRYCEALWEAIGR